MIVSRIFCHRGHRDHRVARGLDAPVAPAMYTPGPVLDTPLIRGNAYSRSLPGTARIFIALCLAFPISAQGDETTATEREMEAVQSQIETVQTRIRSAENEVELMLAELQKYETAAAEVATAIRRIDSDIDSGQDRLTALNEEFDQLGANLRSEKDLLSEQVRAMYRTGRNDYVKLLLNQENPALFGRTLAYHDYFNRARTKRIETVRLAQEQLKSLQEKIHAGTEQLISLRSGKQEKLAELTAYREDREKLLVRSRRYIDDQDRQLQALLKTERELDALLARLRRNEEVYGDETPFVSLKGKLSWPVRGKIITRYGELKKGGKIKSQGITFAAGAGIDVHAISSGTVVYADWFRNLGLLLILDHGDGFMSLYGYNEVLLKKAGDRVGKNSPIARTGDTGGQNNPGLYFEIRREGDPLNPSLWCRA